jgi:DNA-binding beta-propeller fold protein YncE
MWADLWGQAAIVDRTFGTFSNAVSLSVNAGGELFVLDAGRNELSQFSPSGKLLKTIGGRGWGDLEFDSPTDVCANFALDIYVAEYNNRRLQRFDRKMNLVQSFTVDNIMPSLSGAFYPRACALSSQGEMFVVESDGRRILKFTPAQQLEREFGSFNAGAGALLDPHDIAVTPEGRVLVLDGHRVVEFDTYANYIASISLDSLPMPTSISATSNSLLVVDAQRIAVYSNDGTKQGEVTAGSIVGLEGKEEFRDAVATSTTLYILTLHTVIVVKLSTR